MEVYVELLQAQLNVCQKEGWEFCNEAGTPFCRLVYWVSEQTALWLAMVPAIFFYAVSAIDDAIAHNSNALAYVIFFFFGLCLSIGIYKCTLKFLYVIYPFMRDNSYRLIGLHRDHHVLLPFLDVMHGTKFFFFTFVMAICLLFSPVFRWLFDCVVDLLITFPLLLSILFFLIGLAGLWIVNVNRH
jgi:hypothetical protein